MGGELSEEVKKRIRDADPDKLAEKLQYADWRTQATVYDLRDDGPQLYGQQSSSDD